MGKIINIRNSSNIHMNIHISVVKSQKKICVYLNLACNGSRNAENLKLYLLFKVHYSGILPKKKKLKSCSFYNGWVKFFKLYTYIFKSINVIGKNSILSVILMVTFLLDPKTPLQRNNFRKMVRYEVMYLLLSIFTASFIIVTHMEKY